MDPSLPLVDLSVWRADVIVLFDWLSTVDLDRVPVTHRGQKQALADLLTRIEAATDVPYGAGGSGLSQDEIDQALAEVSANMGW